MFHYVFLFAIALILNSNEAALNTEEIIGGYPAYPPNHKYNAAIMGQYSYNNMRYLICNGAIIGDFFVLTARSCLYQRKQEILKNISFFVLVGTIHLNDFHPFAKEIKEVYTLLASGFLTVTDLAIVKLKYSLNLKDNPNLISIGIPDLNQTYSMSGIISGYGAITNNFSRKYPSKSHLRVTAQPRLNLTYAFVSIPDDDECERQQQNILKMHHLCGVIRPDIRHERRGICTGDIGTPLVIEDNVVGISIIKNPDCDDTVKGGVYARVALYKPFIDAIMSENYTFIGIEPIVVHTRPRLFDRYTD